MKTMISGQNTIVCVFLVLLAITKTIRKPKHDNCSLSLNYLATDQRYRICVNSILRIFLKLISTLRLVYKPGVFQTLPLSSQSAAELQNGKTTHANFIEEIPSVFFTERRLHHKGCIHFTHGPYG